MRKKTTEQFIADARAVHGEKYDYSKLKYVGALDKVCIVCPKHGEFWQTPSAHLRGAGCAKCHTESNKSSKEAFVKKCIEVYGEGRYDYSKVDYHNSKEKVCIICPQHGEFWMTPNNHMRGHGCPACYGTPKKTTQEFIRQARLVHGDKYDYSKVVYNRTNERVCIICPEHGEFWQAPSTHLHGAICPYCSGIIRGYYPRITEDIFLKRAAEVHNGKYDYSKVHFVRTDEKVCIICPEHGEFWQKPSIHLRGYGCQKCGGSQRLTTEEFIEKANKVHEGKYDYSKTCYVNTSTKVCITCPDHGDFWQVPNNHLLGAGCPKCAGKYNDRDYFIERARKVHGDKYDYSKVEYIATNEKVCIVCPKHGEFWQTPSGHMHGQGCPMCNQSHIERDVMRFLRSQKIKFVAQKSFDWLVSSRTLRLDFFLLDYSVAIECQGGQHFSAIDYYGGEVGLRNTQERDALKKQLCEEHGIRVLYFSNLGITYPYPVFEDLNALLQAIKDSDKADPTLWKDPELPFVFED